MAQGEVFSFFDYEDLEASDRLFIDKILSANNRKKIIHLPWQPKENESDETDSEIPARNVSEPLLPPQSNCGSDLIQTIPVSYQGGPSVVCMQGLQAPFYPTGPSMIPGQLLQGHAYQYPFLIQNGIYILPPPVSAMGPNGTQLCAGAAPFYPSMIPVSLGEQHYVQQPPGMVHHPVPVSGPYIGGPIPHHGSVPAHNGIPCHNVGPPMSCAPLPVRLMPLDGAGSVGVSHVVQSIQSPQQHHLVNTECGDQKVGPPVLNGDVILSVDGGPLHPQINAEGHVASIVYRSNQPQQNCSPITRAVHHDDQIHTPQNINANGETQLGSNACVDVAEHLHESVEQIQLTSSDAEFDPSVHNCNSRAVPSTESVDSGAMSDFSDAVKSESKIATNSAESNTKVYPATEAESGSVTLSEVTKIGNSALPDLTGTLVMNVTKADVIPTQDAVVCEPVVSSLSEVTKSCIVTTPEVTKPKPMCWASLLQNTPSATNAIVINVDNAQRSSGTPQKSSSAEKKTVTGAMGGRDVSTSEEGLALDASADGRMKKELSELLRNHKLSHRSVSLQPRGLTNRANWCYVNATLQALLACPPFFHLLRAVPKLPSSFWETNKMPVMRSMVQFMNEFQTVAVKHLEKQPLNSKSTVKLDIKSGPSFEPAYVYKMLQEIDYEAFKHGQQEDAEEFLSCILNRLHDEMVAAIKCMDREAIKPVADGEMVTNGNHSNGVIDCSASSPSSTDQNELCSDDARWEQVRSRNRTVFNSVADGESSPISAIFRGQICCLLHQSGLKESATLQPFFTLQLDIQAQFLNIACELPDSLLIAPALITNENVTSVQDALQQLVSRESLQGYTCTKSKVEVDATRRTLLEELPPVLVLHLKWFTYNKSGGMQKCMKQVDFDVNLEISKDLLSGIAKSKSSEHLRKYKLFAAVNHIGVRAIGGHYTVDIFHPGYNCWVRCDDNIITSVPPTAVTKFNPPKVPYLIFYRRVDLTS